MVSIETDDFLFMVTQGKFENFDDVVDAQAIDHNFTTKCADSVISFSIAGLMCLLNDIVAAFSVATAPVESTVVLLSHTRYVRKFDDVVALQHYF